MRARLATVGFLLPRRRGVESDEVAGPCRTRYPCSVSQDAPANRARVSLGFERREDAVAFVAQHSGAVAAAPWRQRWWAQLDLDVHDRDFNGVYERAGAFGIEGHRVYFWPTGALDVPLREQVDVLFAHRDASPIHFGFLLTGAGWARVVVATRSASTDDRASDYADDTLGELAKLGLAALRGDPAASMSFWDEPGELRVTVRGEGDEIVVEVRKGDGDYYGGPSEKKPVLELSTQCKRRELGLAVLRCLDDVLHRYDLDGYAALWRMTPFPSALHAELRRALAASV